MPLRTIILLFLCILPGLIQAKDFKRIMELPSRLESMKIEGHKKWDSGITNIMVEGTTEFNAKLIRIIKDLIGAYYLKDSIPDAKVDEFVKSLISAHVFRQQARNPDGESQGTLASFEVPSSITVDLEETIVEMIEAITEFDPSFDFPAWKKSWDQASRARD